MVIGLTILIILVIYITYKFCKTSSISDNQELEDKLFLETYVYPEEERCTPKKDE